LAPLPTAGKKEEKEEGKTARQDFEGVHEQPSPLPSTGRGRDRAMKSTLAEEKADEMKALEKTRSATATSELNLASNLAIICNRGILAAAAAADVGPGFSETPLAAVVTGLEDLTDELRCWADLEFPGDYNGLVAAAEGGRLKAQAALGVRCLVEYTNQIRTKSKGVDANPMRWLGKAAQRNSSAALFIIGSTLLLKGSRGSVLDSANAVIVSAVQYVETAAFLGLDFAQYAMGAFHFTEFADMEPDIMRSLSWYEQAAAQGLREADVELGHR